MNIAFLPDFEADLEELKRDIPFEQRSVEVYGKTYPQPRLTKWYGPVPYVYSGLKWPAAPMPPLVQGLCEEVCRRTQKEFNSVLANFYRDGNDCVGWHSDDEPLFGRDPEIASLSFGTTRTFKFRRKDDNKVQVAYELTHGSLLFMGRGVQMEWQHTIPRTKKPIGERLNLTFRRVI